MTKNYKLYLNLTSIAFKSQKVCSKYPSRKADLAVLQSKTKYILLEEVIQINLSKIFKSIVSVL